MVQRKYHFVGFVVGFVYFKDPVQSRDSKCMSNGMLFREYQAKTPSLYRQSHHDANQSCETHMVNLGYLRQVYEKMVSFGKALLVKDNVR